MKIKLTFFPLFIFAALWANSQSPSLSDTTFGDKHDSGLFPAPHPIYFFDYVKAAQTYWKYRYRLVGDFISPDSVASATVAGEPGFIILGDNGLAGHGLSSVPIRRNSAQTNGGWACGYQSLGNGLVSWSDGQGNELGKYLAVLATEWELLRNNRLTTVSSNETEWELYYAMKSFNRIEQVGYLETPEPLPENQGIFFRDDAPNDLAQTIFAPGTFPPYNPSYPYKCYGSLYQSIASTYSCPGNPCPHNTHSNPGMMSIDQASKMLWGLAFVVHSIHHGDIVINGYDISDEASAAMGRIIGWVKNQNGASSTNPWILVDATGNNVCQGATAKMEATPLVSTGYQYAYQDFHDAWSSTAGAYAWNGLFDVGLFYSHGNWAAPNGNDYDLFLGVLAGYRPFGANGSATLLNPFFTLAGIAGGHAALRYWAFCIANVGGSNGWPYLDLASAYLNSYRPYYREGVYQGQLTNPSPLPSDGYYGLKWPYCWPCDMPLMDYTDLQRHHTPHSGFFVGWNAISQINLPDFCPTPGDQYNGLDYMLFYNLYCLEFGAGYLDAALGPQVVSQLSGHELPTYSDLKDRIVMASYPFTVNGVSFGGTAQKHLYVGAETNMTFNGSIANSGTYIDFQAPYLGSHPLPFDNTPNGNIWIKYGAVCTFTNGRPPCGSALIPGTSVEYKSLDDDNSTDTITTEMLQMVAMMQKHILDSLSNSSYTADSSLQDVNFTLNVYPNPVSSQCTISLSLPTSARVSMEMEDPCGRLVGIVLKESDVAPGNYDYQFERESLAGGTYLLIIYVNDKRFVRKLVII